MHYCRFYNTLKDMRDLEDDLLDPNAELSEEEQETRERMIELIHHWHEELREQEFTSYPGRQEKWLKTNNVGIGDEVKITDSSFDEENGWNNTWEDQMWGSIGMTGKVVNIDPVAGIDVSLNVGGEEYAYLYSYFVLKKV